MMPHDYVYTQREANLRHSDKSIDTLNEEVLSYYPWLISEIKDMGVPHVSVLDVGCRTGYSLPVLKAGFETVLGCDVVSDFVAIANSRGRAVEADMHSLPFKDGDFDWITCTATIEHGYDLPKAVSEIFRVACVGVYIATDLQNEAMRKLNPSHYVNRETVEDWLKDLHHPDWHLTSIDVIAHTWAQFIWLHKDHFPTLKRGTEWHTKRLRS